MKWKNKYYKAIKLLYSNKYKGGKMLITHCEGKNYGKKFYAASIAISIPMNGGIYSEGKGRIIIDGEEHIVITGYNFAIDDILSMVDGLVEVRKYQTELELEDIKKVEEIKKKLDLINGENNGRN